MVTLQSPAAAAALLERLRARNNFGFLTSSDVAELASNPSTRLTQCLVRCGGCRFTAAAQDVAHLIAIIERDGTDYVRDVAFR